jgi:2-desacetyl-2-hydroxyethyl bacteriochlorophyllide A dehydrogenase
VAQVVDFTRSHEVSIREYAERPLKSGELRIKTLYSGISAGTELTAYRGTNPYLHKRWDETRRLFVESETPQFTYPVSGWGYEEVGEVVEVHESVESIGVGEHVCGAWGHRTHHVVSEAYAKPRILPPGLDPILGIFSQIGAIALNGVHDGRVRIGETVAVFGLGVPGQIIAQLAKRSGARVIGIDLVSKRLELAKRLGSLDITLLASEGSVAERIRELTDNRGADVAFEASGASPALNEAIRSVAYSSKVVALGFYQGAATQLTLGEEFHHNRINIVCSQISGVDPELSYRWNELRMVQTVIALQAQGVLNLEPLISHRTPFHDAAKAFELLDTDPNSTLQVVLDFSDS